MKLIDKLVPHSGKMLLLDQVLDWGKDWLRAEVKVDSDSMFFENGGVSTMVAIEYMAQSIAALAGIRAKTAGSKVRIGMLLGTRKFSTNAAQFAKGAIIVITVKELFLEENGLAVFQCQADSGKIQVSCNLNVYNPEDITTVL